MSAASPAVYTRGVAAAPGAAWVRVGLPATVQGVAAAAHQLGRRVVYVLGDMPLEALDGTDDLPWRTAVEVEPGKTVQVVAPAFDAEGAGGPFGNVHAGDLLDVFRRLELLLGVPWADGVGHTAERLIRSTHPPERGGTALDRTAAAVPPPCEARNLELPYSWRRELTAAEQRCEFVHAFDKNAQHLAAWSVVELGVGVPIHHATGLTFHPSRAGVWRLDGLPPLVDAMLPECWTPGREWYTTPTVARMLEVCAGYDAPRVLEAWTWPSKSRYLRGAAERIGNARTAALAVIDQEAERLAAGEAEALGSYVVAQTVYDAVKALYQRQTGRFLSGGRDPSSGFARPDWGHFVIAQARVNLHRRLEKLGVRPFVIATDGLLFASDEPDGEKFAERIGLPVGVTLRDYSYEGTGRLSDVVAAAAESPRSMWPLFAAVKGGQQ